jgi:hypothetical protein
MHNQNGEPHAVTVGLFMAHNSFSRFAILGTIKHCSLEAGVQHEQLEQLWVCYGNVLVVLDLLAMN